MTGLIILLSGVFQIYILIQLAIVIAEIIANILIFVKAKQPGWAAIMPIYSNMKMYEIVGMSKFFVVLDIIAIIINLFIDFENMDIILILVFLIYSIAYFIIAVIQNLKLAKVFGKSGLFRSRINIITYNIYLHISFW